MNASARGPPAVVTIMMKRRQTTQELRVRTCDPFIEWCDDLDLQDDLDQLDWYISGRFPAPYLWNSPWYEFDAPEWVNGRLGAVPGWWHPWRECGEV